METAKNLIANLFRGDGHTRTCEVCGHEYDQCFAVHMHGETHIFDSFECAIHALAPKCARCGCQVIGHGVAVNGHLFCSAHCADQSGLYVQDVHNEPERSPA